MHLASLSRVHTNRLLGYLEQGEVLLGVDIHSGAGNLELACNGCFGRAADPKKSPSRGETGAKSAVTAATRGLFESLLLNRVMSQPS